MSEECILCLRKITFCKESAENGVFNEVSDEYIQFAKANKKNVITKIEILSEDETAIAGIGDDVISGSDNYDFGLCRMFYAFSH